MNKSLFYDDQGHKLEIGDFVTVNETTVTMVFTDDEGNRVLQGFSGPIRTLEKVSLEDEA